jgi:hypothetical protein
MALSPITVTVREGDSFDELYLRVEKPWGKPYNYTNSVLVADIRRYFNNTTTAPSSTVDSFGVVRLKPTEGLVALKLTSRQTEALGRNVPLGYEERGLTQSGVSFGVDPSDEPQGVYLWDLREYFAETQAQISGIAAGTAFTSSSGVTSNRVRITTTTNHGLTEKDQVLISGTGQTVYDGVNFSANTLQIISPTVFELVPTSAGAPAFSVSASSGTISVYKEDTLAIGTLEVIPRISRDSVS